MSWLAQHWDAVFGAAGFLFGGYQKLKRRKERRSASELDAIRTEAGTKASWEKDLTAESQRLRSEATTRTGGKR